MFTTMAPQAAAVYCRVSSEAQQERQTIENQIEFARKYCDLNNIDIIEIYKDDGITGTLPLDERPAGFQLLQDAKAGKFKLLLIFKLDRLGRSTRVILNAVHDLDAMGVLVRSMTEPFDTSNPSGKFLLTILAGVADLERSNILQRMNMGATRAAKEGKWLGGIVPYGYIKNDDGFLEINNNLIPGFDLSEPNVVRMIYHMCANEGATSIAISDHLNALGIPPAWVAHNLGGKRRNNTRGTWSSSRILRILRSTTYKGIHKYGKRTTRDRELIEREVPAIVDVDIWERAQIVVKGNQIDSLKNAKHKYLLKSIIKCELCGATYRGNPTGNKSKNGYYSCGGRSNWRRMGRAEKCQGMSINMKWLDDFVWNDCLKFINNPGLVIESIENAASDREADKQMEAMLVDRLTSLNADHERMIDLYRQKIISIDDLTGQLEKIKKDRDTAQVELDTLREKHAADQFFEAKESAMNMLNLLKESINSPDLSFEMKQTIIRTMVEKITILTTDIKRAKITIHYRFHSSSPADFTRTVNRTGNRADNCAGIITTMTNYPPAPSPGTTTQERILYLQFRENLSHGELSAIGKCSLATISNIVNGHSVSLCMDTIKAMGDYFGLPYYFIGAYDQLPDSTIPEQLRKGRLYRLMSLVDAAAFFAVSNKTYCNWEHGRIGSSDKAKRPDPDKLAKWTAIFTQNKLGGRLVPVHR